MSAVALASTLGGFAACSGGGGEGEPGPAAGEGGAGGSLPYGAAGVGLPAPGGSGGLALPLHVEPAEVTLVARGAPFEQAFVARLSDGSAPGGVEWSTDDAALGFVGADGVFRSKGFFGGRVTVVARSGGRRASAVINVSVDAVDNAGGLSAGDRAALQAGGDGDPNLGFLYPYDATVFPRGVGAPVVQLRGAKATAARLLIEATGYRYEGFFALAGPGGNRVALPDAVWKGLLAAAPPGETVRVSATTLAGGRAAGPVAQGLSVAPGSLKGVVYYNTYNSTKTSSGAVMKIRHGGEAEVLLDGCTVCHSVSSQGNRLVAGLDWDDVDLENNEVPNNPIDSGSFELKADGTAALTRRDEDGRRYTFGALTPDGSWFLSNGVLGEGNVNGPPVEIRGLAGDERSRLVETDTGAVVPAPSLQALGVKYAMTPAFSHDGTLVAFNRREANEGRTLSLLRFEGKITPPVFSGLVDLVTVSGEAGRRVAAWPSFLPDAAAVVYHEGSGFDTYTPGSKANLRLVELATRRVRELRALNGQRSDGRSYLPYGADDEGDMNFEPTVLPVPVGGYYWVFFTSRRAYGNTIATEGGLVPGGDDLYGWSQKPSPRKKLWVAAIDLDYADRAADEDPSHPAFYLPGQEVEAGNMRAFAALEPCRQNGSSCESGAECCGGFCRQTGVGANNEPAVACVPPPEACSREDEACGAATDCCEAGGPAMLCINGRCAQRRPVVR